MASVFFHSEVGTAERAGTKGRWWIVVRRMRRIGLVGAMVAACLCVGACAKNRLAREQKREARTPVGEWRLVEIGNDEVATIAPAAARAPSLRIHPDGSVTGFTGVNQMRGLLDYHGFARGRFHLSDPVTTRMAGPPEMMEVEQRFLAALGGERSFKVEDGRLAIKGGNEPVLEFVRAE